MRFHWGFPGPVIEELTDALKEYPGCAFTVHPKNADGSALTDEQVKAFGELKLDLYVTPAVHGAVVLNSSWPCPPVCG